MSTRVSCCAYSYRDDLTSGRMSLESFLETVQGLGLDGVELTAYYFPTTERTYLNDLKRRAHRLGLAISGTATGTDFTQPDAQKRRAHVEMARQWIDHSVVLGAPTMRVFAGPVREGVTEDQSVAWCAECLQECAAYAAERGVLLALENHGGITQTSEQALRVYHAVGSEWVGLNLDFGNFTGDIYSQFERCAPYAVATHAKSHYRKDGGREAVDYARVKSILDAAAYHGFIAIEYEEPEDPAAAVPRFARELITVFHAQ